MQPLVPDAALLGGQTEREGSTPASVEPRLKAELWCPQDLCASASQLLPPLGQRSPEVAKEAFLNGY